MVIWLIHLISFLLLIRHPVWRYWLWNRNFSLILKVIRYSIGATGWYFRSCTLYSDWNIWMNFSRFSIAPEVLGLPCCDQRPSPTAPDDVSTTVSDMVGDGGVWLPWRPMWYYKFMLLNSGSCIIGYCRTLCRWDRCYCTLIMDNLWADIQSGMTEKWLLLDIYLTFWWQRSP